MVSCWAVGCVSTSCIATYSDKFKNLHWTVRSTADKLLAVCKACREGEELRSVPAYELSSGTQMEVARPHNLQAAFAL